MPVKPRTKMRIGIKACKAIKINIKVLFLMRALLVSLFLLIKEKL